MLGVMGNVTFSSVHKTLHGPKYLYDEGTNSHYETVIIITEPGN